MPIISGNDKLPYGFGYHYAQRDHDNKVVRDVIMVRFRVLFILLSMFDSKLVFVDPFVFSYPVKDDYGIIYRISDQCQYELR